ncbi:hypothetical protein [Nostoc sp.]|uniref:hypothetical protein n=1 Tax=Nostoc sp. TaxID=1180 RepID=UPI002FFCD742
MQPNKALEMLGYPSGSRPLGVYIPQTPLAWLSGRKGAVAPQLTQFKVFGANPSVSVFNTDSKKQDAPKLQNF